MTTFTKERLEEIAADGFLKHGESKELARIALASLEAGPVAYMWDSERKDIDAPGYYRPEHLVFAESSVKQWGGRVVPLYSAPPALTAEPVVITDDMAYAFHHALSDSSLGADEVEEIKTGLRAAFANVTAPPAQVVPADISGIIGRFQHQADHLSDCHHIDEHSCKVNRRDLLSAIEFMNACRAAMLHGAENTGSGPSNSPVIPEGFCVAAKTSIPVISDGWVAFSEREPENKPGSYEYLVFETLNNGVHHDYWNVPDSGDDCQFTPFWNHYDRYVTHWMPLPAAPQQEVE